MGILDIFVGVLEIFDGCPGDIFWVPWRCFIGSLEIFHGSFGDISWVSSRYLIGVMEILDGFLDIFVGVLEIFDRCSRDI